MQRKKKTIVCQLMHCYVLLGEFRIILLHPTIGSKVAQKFSSASLNVENSPIKVDVDPQTMMTAPKLSSSLSSNEENRNV